MVVFRLKLLDCLKCNPNKICQIFDEDQTTVNYRTMKDFSITTAVNLRKLGLNEGDVISVLFSNTTFAAPIIFGSILNGSIFYPILNRKNVFDVEGMEFHLKTFKPKIIVVEQFSENYQEIVEVIRKIGILCRVLVLTLNNTDHIDSVFCAKQMLFNPISESDKHEFLNEIELSKKISDDDTISMIETSGSTGTPKIYPLNGHNFHTMELTWRKSDKLIHFSYSTISWISGVNSLIIPILLNGTRVITKTPFSPESYVRIIKKYQVTNTFMTTPGARQMMKKLELETLSSIEEFMCGGEKISRNVVKYLRSILNENVLKIVYGSTEMGRITSFVPSKDQISSDFNAGCPFNDIKIKIVDLKNEEIEMPAGTFGEILMKSSTLMFRGYVGEDDSFAKHSTKDGWFKSGDVGFVDEHNQLHVVGRKVHMLCVSDDDGDKIHSSFIDSLFEEIDGMCAACTVDLDDDVVGTLCEINESSGLTAETILAFVQRKFEKLRYNFVIHVFLVDTIPRRGGRNSAKMNRDEVIRTVERLYRVKVGKCVKT